MNDLVTLIDTRNYVAYWQGQKQIKLPAAKKVADKSTRPNSTQSKAFGTFSNSSIND